MSRVAAVAEHLHVDEIRAEDTAPDWNVTPRREILVVAETPEHVRVLDRARWGLVPPWADDLSIGDRMINARGDTIAQKPAFKRAFTRRRCLIPVDGFYEWKAVPGRKTKQPVYIHAANEGDLLVFAGIYETWRRKDTPQETLGAATSEGPDEATAELPDRVRSCAIVTTDANTLIAAVHHRMPVVLAEQDWDAWLDPDNTDSAALQSLLVPAPEDALAFHPVRTLVNSPRNNFAELLEPAPAETLFE